MSGTQVFLYPEELDASEPQALAEQILGLGCDAVSVALTYHRARRVLPRQRRVSLSPGGAISFTPEVSRYGRLVPEPTAPPERRVAVERFRAACAERGLAFRAWLVALHNETLAANHREAAAETLDGEPTGFGLCPSATDTVEYAVALANDVRAQFEPDGIDLEAALYAAWEPSYTLTLALEPLSESAQTFGSQCFCASCSATLGEQLRERTRRAAGPPFAAERADDPELERELAAARATGVKLLVDAVATGGGLCVTASGPAPSARLRGLARDSVAAAERVLLGMARLSGSELTDRLEAMRGVVGEKPFTASLNWFPERTADVYKADAERVAAAGADRLALYNLSLVPDHAFPALAAAARAFAEASQ
jgi:hypothetical protein